MAITIPPFVLYGLIGCPHCNEAEMYLRKAGVPFMSIVSNDDVIIDEGIKKILGLERSEYPVLLYKISKEVVKGFQPDQYERLTKSFYSFVGSSAPSTFSGQQQPVTENQR